MKKTIIRYICVILIALMSLSFMTSCGFADVLFGKGDFLLTTDKYYIQPNGSDIASFVCFDNLGNEISSENIAFYINGKLSKTASVSSQKDETFDISAEWNGMKSNTVRVYSTFSSDLPVVVIETAATSISTSSIHPTEAGFFLYEPTDSGRTVLSAGTSHACSCTIHVRGQSSAFFNKKQYKISFTDGDSKSYNASLLGMDKDSDWILNGSYIDKTLLHNYLAYTLGQDMNFDWTPSVRFVEVYVTRDRDNIKTREYLGVYLLIESIKVGAGRVNITKGNSSTPASQIGYLFSKDKTDEDSAKNMIPGSLSSYELIYPSSESVSKEQKKYISDKIRQFERALCSANFADPEKGYRKYFDVDSYIDYIILAEYMKNVDGVRLSSYFSVDTDGIIKYAAIWDWDISCGACDYGFEWNNPEFFLCLDPETRGVDDYAWLDRLLKDPWFTSRLAARYHELRNGVLSDENVQSVINDAYNTIHESAARNSIRWKELYDGFTYVWPNSVCYTSHIDEVNAMKIFLHRRGLWLDEHIDDIVK